MALTIKAEILARKGSIFIRKPVYEDMNIRLAVLAILYNRKFGKPASLIVKTADGYYVRCTADNEGGYSKEFAHFNDPDVKAIDLYLAGDWQNLSLL